MDVFRDYKFRLLVLIVPVLFIWGCSAATRSRMMVDGMEPMLEKMKAAVNKNPDIELLEQAIPASLVQLDGLIEVSPNNTYLLVRGAEANAGYAFAFIIDKDKERAKRYFKKGRDYALRALRQNDDFDKAYDKQIDEFTESLEGFDKEDVPALFFAASTWLQWIGLNLNDPAALMDLGKVEALMQKVLELDDTYMYGSIHASWGAYYAARSKTLGGQPEKAKYHFDEAFRISESKYLPFHYLYARYYAVQMQDRELFVSTLEKVISAPENLLPEKNLANEITKRKAKKLLADVDEYF
jgi:tetratricopeptide (TPR) repeat protein